MLLSGTIANLPKRFTRIHSSLLEISAERPLDRALGRPRIGAESSFGRCVYRRGKESLFDIQLANEPPFLSLAGPCSTPLPHARLIRNAHEPWLESFIVNPRHPITCPSGWNAIFIRAKIRDNLSRGRLFKLYLHPAPLRSLSSRAKETKLFRCFLCAQVYPRRFHETKYNNSLVRGIFWADSALLG